LIRAGSEAAAAADFGLDERAWLRTVAERWAPGEISAVLRSYGEADSASVDDRQLLIRLELATVAATGLDQRPWAQGLGAGSQGSEAPTLIADSASLPRTSEATGEQPAPSAVTEAVQGAREEPAPSMSPLPAPGSDDQSPAATPDSPPPIPTLAHDLQPLASAV